MHQGQELRKIRRKRRIKVLRIADKIGVVENSVYDIEKRETVQLEVLKKYCEAIDLPISYFYPDLKEEKKPSYIINESNTEYKQKTHFGNKLKKLRKEKRVNVTEYAKALGFNNRQSVYSMEARSEISFDIIKKAASFLNIPINEILKDELLNTPEIQNTNQSIDDKLRLKDNKIMQLQEKVIDLQEEIVRLNNLLNKR